MAKLKESIQNFLGFKPVAAVFSQLNLALARIFSPSYWLSIPFHWVFFFPFMREQRAVLAGKKKYFQYLSRSDLKSKVALRRNTHRLEKGLVMRPRRRVFAKEYILQTVRAYAQAVSSWQKNHDSYDETELNWAQNVLEQYFAAVEDGSRSIAEARQLFMAQTYQPTKHDMHPYKRGARSNLPSYQQVLNLSEYRRSVRWFLRKKVARKDIDDAILVARQSPSSCNRLPYEFRIFDDPKLVKQVANTPFGTAGYADNIPVIAVLIGKLGSYYSNRDRHGIYVDSALAAMSFAFALETKGISTCMINWPGFEPQERKMAKLLNLDFDERPIMLIGFGYADPEGQVAYSQKKSLDLIRSYNKTG